MGNLKNQTIYGWIHAIQNRNIKDILINNTAFVWKDMFEDGRHTFWKNNEIAGEVAIIHMYSLHKLFPYYTKVAIILKGHINKKF